MKMMAMDLNDQQYNYHRYMLMQMCSKVINLGTTFTLECSLMNLPIAQLGFFGNFQI